MLYPKLLSPILNHCQKNNWIEDALVELSALRSHIPPIIENNASEHYLDLWKKIFTNNAVKQDFKSFLLRFEIFVIIHLLMPK